MGKKTVWDLELQIAGDSKGASAALKDVQQGMKNVQAAGKQLGKDFKNFASNAGKLALGVVAGVTAAGAATLKLAGDFAAAGDQAAKTADSLGMGIEGYQRLRYAMSTAGVEAGEFDGAIQKLSNAINMGVAGNAAAAKQFEDIGLTVQEFANMKPEEAFAKISDHMQTLSSDAERTQMAITLFGKTSGPRMMAAMKMGSEGLRQMGDEAQSLGIIITEEQARASENYGSALSRMKNAFGGLKNQFIGNAIGPIAQAFDHLKDAMVSKGPFIQELGRKFGNFLAAAVQKLPEIIAKVQEFGAWIKDTANRVAGFVGGWKNVAKILAGLAVAPTLISGLKTAFSLGNFIQTAMKGLPKIMAKMGLAAGPLSGALLPIIGIVAGIAAAAFLIVKNWDKVKPVIIGAFNSIKDAVGKVIGALTAWWEEHGDDVITVISNIANIIVGVFSVAWKVLSTAIGIVSTVIGGFIRLVADCVGWLQEHKTVLGAVAITVGTITAAIIAYNAVQAIANAGGLVAVARMGAQAVASGALSVATGIQSTVFGIATVATTAFGAAMAFLTSPITVVIALIGAVVLGAYLIIKNWDMVKGFFVNLWNNVKAIFSNAWEGIKNIFLNYHPVGLVIKHWDKIKDFFINLWENVKAIFSNAWEGIKNVFGAVGGFFSNVWGKVKDTAGKAFEGIKGAAGKAGGWLKDNWKTVAVGMVNPYAGGLKYLYDHNEKFRNACDTVFGKIKDIGGKVWDKMPDGLKDVFVKVKETIIGAITNIKEFFTGLWGAIKEGPTATIEYLKNAFFGLFESIKQKIETFVNFFKEKMEAVKNFFGGIGDKVGGFVGGAVDKFKSFLPGHAEGGIFTQRHIAEIAESGAEAVVPLDRSPHGFDIWKQAGEIGGYADRYSQQTATASTSGAPPVMEAAAQRITGGESVITVNFSQNNTFNGGTDKETVNQISAAGKQAADDFEVRVRQALENIQRDKRRVSFA